MSNENRYKVVNGSQSGHCCFDYTVVDLTKPVMIGGHHYEGRDGELQYDPLCETFGKERADEICRCLNACNKT